jgi:hypothetical protein
LRREISGVIGLVGGLIDLFVGSSILRILLNSMMANGLMMMSASNTLAG